MSSGLIGGMLTAIREFARESFGRGRTDTELDEIQYGDERIILQSGQYAYLAVVIRGVQRVNESERNRTIGARDIAVEVQAGDATLELAK